jgi:hypothetical protein
LNEWLLVSKAGKEGQIGVFGLARLTPTLECESAYEAKLPALQLTDSLQFSGRLDDVIHGPQPS